MLKDIEKHIKTLNKLTVQAVDIYSKIVKDIIDSKSKDIKNIEQTLDGLLGFCYNEEMLKLFKRLCHYYYDIDPHATADYVNIYREMWDSEET